MPKRKDTVTKSFRIRRKIVEYLTNKGYHIPDLARIGVVNKYNELLQQEEGVTKPVQVVPPETVLKKQKVCVVCGKPSFGHGVHNINTGQVEHFCKKHHPHKDEFPVVGM